ncbi:DUF3857 domain-containing protein [Winogradskyella aquimaris]|uniref:DUF3857 domain-containing protein n=1 Tax=Winogradskyella aquimaris TaxID=864074 RepID=A0ABU5EHS4_9FLAO|nr:DUF3857 domain-containing protein [Winogradskyella aquimaris]MDY2585741.1 DUF3857 domain-containing protein [Winogradskyella aquimaris]
MNYLTSAIVLLFTIAAFSQSKELYKSSSIPTELKVKANAVVRYYSVDVSIEEEDEVHIVEKRIVTVLNENGISAIQAGQGYDNYREIEEILAKVYDANGNEIEKFKKRDFADHSAVDGGTLYSDSRVMFMGYSSPTYPYTVEFYCKTITSNTAAIPTWRPIPTYYVSVENATYTFQDKVGLGLRYKEKYFKGYNLKGSNTENTLDYSIQNVKPVLYEDFGPSFSKITPQLMVAVENFQFYGVKGKAKNWEEFGAWINDALLRDRQAVSEKTKQEIKNLTSGIDDPVEKAKKVFEFVQENTRYISVQVGIGGVQPIPAMEVDELKYGDCKGLTNYAQSLLEIAGVPSYYCIVEAGRDIVDLEDDFASLEQGNHIILAIPEKNNEELMWVDCTSQLYPFNFIGDFTDNRNVLVVKPDKSEIIRTKVYVDSLNTQNTMAKIIIDSNGGLKSQIVRKTKGLQYDNRFGIERQDDRDVKLFYKRNWDNINNLQIQDYSFINNKNIAEFTEKLDIVTDNYITVIGDKFLLVPNMFNINTYVPSRYRSRKQSVQISRGYLDQDEYSIIIPSKFEVEALPDNVSVKNDFGEYSFQIKQEGNTITYKRKLFIKRGEYPNSAYKSFRDFMKDIKKWDNSKIVLKAI